MQPADQLVAELNTLGVHFVTGSSSPGPEPALPPTELLANLAQQSEARLRLAIIPLLLSRPDFAPAVPRALSQLNEPAQLTLKLFYTAAMLLQQLHASRLHGLLGRWEPLPDLFSEELGLRAEGGPQVRLKHLGERHHILSGLAANWVGTYAHAAERLMKRLEWEARWETPRVGF